MQSAANSDELSEVLSLLTRVLAQVDSGKNPAAQEVGQTNGFLDTLLGVVKDAGPALIALAPMLLGLLA